MKKEFAFSWFSEFWTNAAFPPDELIESFCMNKDYFNSQSLTGSDFLDALCIRKDVSFHPFFNFHYTAVSASQAEMDKILFW